MGMLIAFWSPLHGRGNTSNCIAVGMQLSMRYDIPVYMTHSHYARSTMESAFLAGDEEEDMLKFSDLGLDSLSRAIKTRCITSSDVKSYCNRINDNLFFISGSKKSSKELFDANIGNDFMEICNFIKQGNNVALIDVDSGYNNVTAKEIIQVADYVVVTLDQTNIHCIEYFDNISDIPKEKEIIMIGRYDYISKYSKRYVSKKFKRDVYVLPSDPDFLDALNNHRIPSFFYKLSQNTEDNMLIDEINILVDRIAEEIEENGMEINIKEYKPRKMFSFKRILEGE